MRINPPELVSDYGDITSFVVFAWRLIDRCLNQSYSTEVCGCSNWKLQKHLFRIVLVTHWCYARVVVQSFPRYYHMIGCGLLTNFTPQHKALSVVKHAESGYLLGIMSQWNGTSCQGANKDERGGEFVWVLQQTHEEWLIHLIWQWNISAGSMGSDLFLCVSRSESCLCDVDLCLQYATTAVCDF